MPCLHCPGVSPPSVTEKQKRYMQKPKSHDPGLIQLKIITT